MPKPAAPQIRGKIFRSPAAPLNWAAAVIALAPAPATPSLEQDPLRRGLTMVRWQGRKVLGGEMNLRMAEDCLSRGGHAWFAFDDAQIARETRTNLRRSGVEFV